MSHDPPIGIMFLHYTFIYVALQHLLMVSTEFSVQTLIYAYTMNPD